VVVFVVITSTVYFYLGVSPPNDRSNVGGCVRCYNIHRLFLPTVDIHGGAVVLWFYTFNFTCSRDYRGLVFEYRGFRPPTTGLTWVVVFIVITSAVYFYLRSIFTAGRWCFGFIRLISLVREITGISIWIPGVSPPTTGLTWVVVFICITSTVYFYLRSIFTAGRWCFGFIRLISLVREITGISIWNYVFLSLEHFIIDVLFAADYLYDMYFHSL